MTLSFLADKSCIKHKIDYFFVTLVTLKIIQFLFCIWLKQSFYSDCKDIVHIFTMKFYVDFLWHLWHWERNRSDFFLKKKKGNRFSMYGIYWGNSKKMFWLTINMIMGKWLLFDCRFDGNYFNWKLIYVVRKWCSCGCLWVYR
jgi:hypothetical protein